MPKRSTEFQRLVFLLKKQLGPEITVTESKMLTDLVTGTEREVDICLEATVAGHNVAIGIECNEKGRRAGPGWVQEMRGKHERLPTALVLVSKSGFTKEAERVAASY